MTLRYIMRAISPHRVNMLRTSHTKPDFASVAILGKRFHLASLTMLFWLALLIAFQHEWFEYDVLFQIEYGVILARTLAEWTVQGLPERSVTALLASRGEAAVEYHKVLV